MEIWPALAFFWYSDPEGLCYPQKVGPSGWQQHLLGASSKWRIPGPAPGQLSQKPHLMGSLGDSFALSHEKQCCGQAKYRIHLEQSSQSLSGPMVTGTPPWSHLQCPQAECVKESRDLRCGTGREKRLLASRYRAPTTGPP